MVLPQGHHTGMYYPAGVGHRTAWGCRVGAKVSCIRSSSCVMCDV